jgi:hypothetical protein
MLQDSKFANDMHELIQEKQKKSAFVYVRNHIEIIEQALNEGAKIADIHTLLQKHDIKITLPTLRLYLHRLRNPKNTKITNKKPEEKLNTHISSLQEVHLIKTQTPNLEELSKAFIHSKS